MKRRSGFGWIQCLCGICMIALGIFSILKPGSMFAGFTILYGILAAITGVCDLVFYIRSERYTGFGPIVALISGVLSVMAGIVLLAYPGAGQWIVSVLLPLWFIAHCISRLAHLDLICMAAGRFYFYFSLCINGIGLILGIVMLFRPVFTIFSVGVVIGSYLVVAGIESLVIAFSKIGSGWGE